MAKNTECPSCGAGGVVCTDSRPSVQKSIVRVRNYRCHACGDRFYTNEVVRRIADNEVIEDPRRVAANFVDDVHREVRRLAQEAFGNENGELRYANHTNR